MSVKATLLAKKFIQTLLPSRCIYCAQSGLGDMDICAECFAELPRNINCCYRCGEHFAFTSLSPMLCGRCLSSPPNFDDTYAPFLYQDYIRHAITQLKFAQQFKHARLLGQLLANYLAENAHRPELIIPMPLHINRYRERQFNQAVEIARHVAKYLDIPLDLHSCIRQRDTPHQTGLPAIQRQTNLRTAFSLSKPLAAAHVAILDDVMTTGATTAALAKLLKQHGVTQVDVWVCARA